MTDKSSENSNPTNIKKRCATTINILFLVKIRSQKINLLL